MKRIELFGGIPWTLPANFVMRLDRNLRALAVEEGPEQTTLDGYTLKDTDTINSLQVDATAAALTVYLPERPVGKRRRTIIKTDSSGNAVTVNGNGNLINGAATQSLAAQYDSITVEPTGTGWLIVAST